MPENNFMRDPIDFTDAKEYIRRGRRVRLIPYAPGMEHAWGLINEKGYVYKSSVEKFSEDCYPLISVHDGMMPVKEGSYLGQEIPSGITFVVNPDEYKFNYMLIEKANMKKVKVNGVDVWISTTEELIMDEIIDLLSENLDNFEQ